MHKTKDRVLLHHLRNAGVKCSNKEVISRNWNRIAGCNAVDLVREVLVGPCRMKQNYGEPSGWGKFLLREANVPRSLFGKRKTLRQLQESHQMKHHSGTYGQPRDEEPELSPCHGQLTEWLALE